MTGPAAGFTVAVTAQRRADELSALLVRRGANVVHAPAVRIVPVADDAELLLATKACLSEPPDVLVATTGIGFRGWMEAAGEWGLADQLTAVLGATRIVARGPKAKGAIRAAGLSEVWSPESESSQEVLLWLQKEDLRGQRIAVQLHGHPLPEFVDPLREQGATVVEISPYRWLPPVDTGPLRRLLDLIVARNVDAVTFTSAPAALVLLEIAEEDGVTPGVLNALQEHVLAVCVGPITAEVLERLGVPVVQPERARLGALAREVIAQLERRVLPVNCKSASLGIRSSGVVVNGVFQALAPAPMAVLRALAAEPGVVCSRSALATVLPGGADNEDHAVDVAVARLRSGLGDPTLVQTVVRRGYRLAV